MNPKRPWAWLGLVLGVLAPGFAFGEVQVDVELSPFLREAAPRIDQVERRSEEEFRKHRAYEDVDRRSERAQFADSVLNRVEWANERLVPDAAEYGVEKLVQALVRDALAKAGLESYSKRIRVTVDQVGVRNHPVAPLRGASEHVSGRFEEIDPASGQTLRAAEVVSNLVVSPTADRSYHGPDLAFDDTDPTRRVGPALAYFVTKGLEKLFPDRTFPKVVTVLFADRENETRPRLVRVR